jgi:hypothetical protein
MTIELVKIQDSETASPIYYITIDGNMLVDGWSGNYNEAFELYNKIVNNPNYLNERKVVLHSVTITP